MTAAPERRGPWRDPIPPGDVTAWAVTDGAAGALNQCVGLARRLGIEPDVKTIAIRQPWRGLPPALWFDPLAAVSAKGDRLDPPWPDLLIASGRKSVAPAAAIRRAASGGTVAVQIQDPGIAPRHFDLVVAPVHDRLRGANVVATKGTVHGLTREGLDAAARAAAPAAADLPRPLVFVAIGGPNRVYRFDEEDARRLGRSLAAVGGGLLVALSRRTTGRAAAALEAELDPARTRFWNGAGENPYFGWLGLARAVVITADSVAMTTEACVTGRPVYVARLAGGSAKFERFHGLMERDGHARRFEGAIDFGWRPASLDETGRVADRVREILGGRVSWPGS